MKTKLRPILGLIITLVIFSYVFKGRGTIDVISAIFAPTVFFIYMYRTTELRKALSEELFKKKRRKMHLYLCLLSWVFGSAILIIKQFQSQNEVSWFKEIGLSIGFAVIMYVGMRAYDYFSRQLSTKLAK